MRQQRAASIPRCALHIGHGSRLALSRAQFIDSLRLWLRESISSRASPYKKSLIRHPVCKHPAADPLIASRHVATSHLDSALRAPSRSRQSP